jgi:hypothetical protein
MDVKETGKQIREILLLLLEGGFVMPIILTSIDRYGSIMVAEYTPVVVGCAERFARAIAVPVARVDQQPSERIA